MPRLNTRIAIAVRTNYFSCSVDAKYIGKLKVRAHIAPLVITGGFEGGQQGASTIHVFSDRIAVTIVQISGIGKQQSAVPVEVCLIEIAFMHKIEDKAALKQRIVKSLK